MTVNRIIGRTKLQRKLQRLPVVAKARIKQALEASAEEVVGLAKRLVPVGQGALRDSIGWTYGRAPSGSITLGTVADTIGSELTITIFAGSNEAFYARFVEFGTQNARAQPFFYPSWRASRRRAQSRVRRAVNRAAREVAAS